jgi:O-antigen/teichoic acid export membrane protein
LNELEQHEPNRTAPPSGDPVAQEAAESELSLRDIAGGLVTGSIFQIGSQAITLVLGFARSVLVLRLLLPADVGVVAIALVLVNFIGTLATFGLNAALVQRDKAEPEAVSTHFVLRAILVALSFGATVLCIPLFRLLYPGVPLLIPVVLGVAGVRVLAALYSTPMVLLQRRLAYRRLAALDVLSSAAMLVVAPLLAWRGWGPWSLVVGEQLTGTVVSMIGLWLYRPPWRLSTTLSRPIASQYLRFGRVILANVELNFLLDQFDDFWVGKALGATAAGFYSKAYEFARYPRRIIAMPLQPVFFSAYARLQSDRRRLSQAYHRLNSFVVRAGFLFSMILVLVAPEFIELLLTAKWLPMVNTFRLMVVYSLLDPLIVTAGNLTIAVGHPTILTRIKLVQAAVFVPAVIVFAARWGIDGVAVAADLMLLVGITSILYQVRRFVDFSLKSLFRYPLIALVLGGAGGWLAGQAVGPANLWLSLIAKAGVAGSLYVAVLLLFEHAEYRRNLDTVLHFLGLERFGSGRRGGGRARLEESGDRP